MVPVGNSFLILLKALMPLMERFLFLLRVLWALPNTLLGLAIGGGGSALADGRVCGGRRLSFMTAALNG